MPRGKGRGEGGGLVTAAHIVCVCGGGGGDWHSTAEVCHQWLTDIQHMSATGG